VISIIYAEEHHSLAVVDSTSSEETTIIPVVNRGHRDVVVLIFGGFGERLVVGSPFKDDMRSVEAISLNADVSALGFPEVLVL